MIEESQFLWQADDARLGRSNIAAFTRWLDDSRSLAFDSYQDLWQWSVDDIDGFWSAIWDYFDILHDGDPTQVRHGTRMQDMRWFPQTRLNYAEHVLRHEQSGDPARDFLTHSSELRPLASCSWAEMGAQVRRLATALRARGIGPGDYVAAYMPNILETTVAMLATTAVGATWANAAPEFGAQTVIDRFSQIKPKLVFAANGYRYGGKDFDRRGQIAQILQALPSVEQLVWLDYLPDLPPAAATDAPVPSGVSQLAWQDMLAGPDIAADDFRYERVGSDHPLWVLFSSGTTGLPKAIVHSHHGIVLEHYKSAAFHFEIRRDDCLFFYSTTGWMMWNTLMQGPLMNARVVLYDGHPAWPSHSALWDLAAASGATVFGTNPTFLQLLRDGGYAPKDHHDLSALRAMVLIGSPATPEIFDWCYKAIKADLWVSSQSGGTEFCSGLLGGSEWAPVRAGEIQGACLGVDAHAFDAQGAKLLDATGELVVLQPMPSMPLALLGDADGARYRDSYFSVWPDVWQHGDLAKFKSGGGTFLYGRSDATLNRFGVRIGSAEIYRTLETFPQIADSLIVCVEDGAGGYYMPLFVTLRDGISLDAALVAEIRKRLRQERSPRHVPDEIHQAPSIPATLTGKKMEIPVRKLLLGHAIEDVASKGAMRDGAMLDWFAAFANRYHARRAS